MLKKRLTNGNKKVKALLFSLSPVISCLNCKSCASTCYAVKSYRQYPNVKALWDSNLELAREDLGKLRLELSDQLSRTKQTIVRIHQSGDFISQDYIDMWISISIEFPNIMFYGYTKVDKLFDFTVVDVLPNMNIIRSMVNGKRNYGSMDYISKLVEEEGVELCPATLPGGESIKCGVSCFKCMEKGTKVAFLQH